MIPADQERILDIMWRVCLRLQTVTTLHSMRLAKAGVWKFRGGRLRRPLQLGQFATETSHFNAWMRSKRLWHRSAASLHLPISAGRSEPVFDIRWSAADRTKISSVSVAIRAEVSSFMLLFPSVAGEAVGVANAAGA